MSSSVITMLCTAALAPAGTFVFTSDILGDESLGSVVFPKSVKFVLEGN